MCPFWAAVAALNGHISLPPPAGGLPSKKLSTSGPDALTFENLGFICIRFVIFVKNACHFGQRAGTMSRKMP